MISTIDRNRLIAKLRQVAQDNGFWWAEPLISREGNCLEWQHGNRKLTLYLESWGFEVYATYGDDTDELSFPYDADFLPLWRWVNTP